MGDRLRKLGMHVARYGLVIVLLWIGGMKFTAYEAEGIKPLVANSPLLGWIYQVMSVVGFASLLGVIEIAIGLLIALRPIWPGFGRGERTRGGNVPDHAELPDHHSRLGAEPGRVSRPSRPCRGSSSSRTSSCWEWRCSRPERRWEGHASIASSSKGG